LSTATICEEERDRKAAALALAERGFHVFAVDRKDKRPDRLLAPEGFKGATRDPEVIAGWFDVKPNANIGIACGVEYGLVAIDVDVKNGARGMETLRDLELGLPTLIANTPSGGLHIYFKHPGVPLVAKLDGIDIKGADGGGYVLAPPSTLPTGAYRWRDDEMPVADMPPDLLQVLTASKPQKAAPSGPVASIKVPLGRRHDRLVELGAIYRGKGLSDEDIELLLWNQAQHHFDPAFSRDNPENVREVESVLRWYGGKAANGAEVLPALQLLTMQELFARAALVPNRDLLEPILPEAGNLMIYGPAGVGKSHLGLCIALTLARGGVFLDWVAAAPVRVLFVDGEMPLPELKSRAESYLAGKPAPDGFTWAAARAQDSEMPDLADPVQQAVYLAAIEGARAQTVVFDNLSCLRLTTADSPENSVEAWHPVASFLRRLNVLGVATVTVHHAAKSGSQRGSSAHVAVMDTVIAIRPPGEGQGDPQAENDVEIVLEKHRRFGGEAAQSFRAKAVGDVDGFVSWQRCGADPFAEDVARLRQAGHSVRAIAELTKRSKAGVQKALKRAQARCLLPLGGLGSEDKP
jgi:hypothetical protein